MARMTGRRLEKKESSLMFREISPPHGWKDDSDFHYLRLTLPGFEAKDITIRMDKYGHLVVRGDKQVSEHKYISFEETFDVPNNAKLEEAEGGFEDNQIYCITMPKKKELGQRSGHAISMPHAENIHNPTAKDKRVNPVHKYNGKDKPAQGLPNNPLKVITGEDKYSQKMIVFFIALLIVLLIVAVVLIVKFHRR